MKKLVVLLVALGIFVGLGLFTASQLGDKALRLAESEESLCRANEGYFAGSGQPIPGDVVNRCGQSIRTFEDGVVMRLVYGGLVGLVVAGLYFLVAWFLFLRRRPAEGAPPPAG